MTMLRTQFLFLIILLGNSYLEATVMTTQTSFDYSLPWDIRDYHGMHISIPVRSKNDKIVFVTGSEDSIRKLRLDSVDPANPKSFHSCIIPRKLKYNSESRREATSLGNGKVIFTMLNNQMSRTSPISAALNVEWRLHIIDPFTCDHTDLVVATTGENLIGVLPYEDSFDVLLKDMKSSKRTRVVRYSENGEIDQTFSAVIPDEHFLRVKMIKEHDPSAGYYYITPLRREGSSTLKILNSNFEVIHSFEFKHSRYTGYDHDAYSLEHGRFTVCYFDQENRKSLRCLTLDEEFKGQPAEVAITYDHEIYHVFVKILPRGGFHVLHAKNNGNHSDTVYLQHVTKDGQVGESVELGIVPRGIHEVYYFEMKDGSQCISISSIDSIMTKYIV
ncbi:uncharacterized protein LOC107980534 [Nasonia vitripennis]|uniref:Uncharacterized protein n=1 Tax=Nasonia vitripennis TaxID=7425 RepID=A0A7M7IYR4_NASVI|nr:uncharacterized protein LOC107980534 [Nasonia vitripennis]